MSALDTKTPISASAVTLLHQVFRRMALDGDRDVDRSARASALIRLYQSGLHTERELRLAMGYEL